LKPEDAIIPGIYNLTVFPEKGGKRWAYYITRPNGKGTGASVELFKSERGAIGRALRAIRAESFACPCEVQVHRTERTEDGYIVIESTLRLV
jgi:hypothetical protein